MSANAPDGGGDRTRPHPDARFASPAQAFDLDAATRELEREPVVAGHGRRQKSLYRHGNASLSLFLFDAGSGMKEHRAAGTVFIQVIAGRLTVRAQSRRHDLTAGSILVMAPDVPHDVHAEEASRMLLTVSLEPTSDGPSR